MSLLGLDPLDCRLQRDRPGEWTIRGRNGAVLASGSWHQVSALMDRALAEGVLA